MILKRCSGPRLATGTCLLTAAFVLAGCGPSQDDVVPVYDSAPVETRNIEVTVDAAGTVEPITTVEVKSKASGEILSVHADTGDIVDAGTLLVEVDKRTPRNNLAQAEAALEAAKARERIAETAMKRSQTLFKSGTLTQSDFEQAQLEHANAKAQTVKAQVDVENARISLDDTEVRAPITGTIIERNVEPGAVISSPTQAVSDGTILMKMANLDTVQVRTLVDETDIGKIRSGMETAVTVAAFPNQPFKGDVLKIEPQAIVDQNVTMFAVLIRLDNSSRLLKPGMNAEVSIQIAKRDDVLAVPTAALRAFSDISTTAAMLGMPEESLRDALGEGAGHSGSGDPISGGGDPISGLDGASGSGGAGAARGATITLRGRTVELPPGVDPSRIESLMAKARSGGELSTDDRQLIRKVLGQAFGGQGGQGGPGGPGGGFGGRGGGPGGGFGGQGGGFAAQGGGFAAQSGGSSVRGAFQSQRGGASQGQAGRGADGQGGRASREGNFAAREGAGGQGGADGAGHGSGVTAYQFTGDYWVVALVGNKPSPKRVRTGLTDLEYSEIISGLGPDDRVLLLPSTSLFEQQAQLQQFISRRFSSGPFQQGRR